MRLTSSVAHGQPPGERERLATPPAGQRTQRAAERRQQVGHRRPTSLSARGDRRAACPREGRTTAWPRAAEEEPWVRSRECASSSSRAWGQGPSRHAPGRPRRRRRPDRPPRQRQRPALGATSLLDRGKRSIALDLKDAADCGGPGLVRRADVLLEGFRPGVMERLGLGPDELLAENPALVYGRMTGWGQTGPLAPAPGTTSATSRSPAPWAPAAARTSGRRRRSTCWATSAAGDVPRAGRRGGAAARAGHGRGPGGRRRDRRRHRRPHHDDPRDARRRRLAGPARGNLLDTGAPFYDVYRCADGQFVAVGALEEQFYAALLDGLGLAGDETLPDRDDPRQWPALRERFTEAFASRTRAEWWAVFAGTDACVAPVLVAAGGDPRRAQRRARACSSRSTAWCSPPSPPGSRPPPGSVGRVPAVGEHNDEIRAELGL